MIREEEKKYIEAIVWRLNVEVVKTMKEIPNGQLFSWKLKNGEKK